MKGQTVGLDSSSSADFDQSTPIVPQSPSGKRIYASDFLMQFQPVSNWMMLFTSRSAWNLQKA